MNIISIIPARSGSKGVVDKNIKLLNGKPLIAYSIEYSLSEGITPYVSTDSEEYAKIAREYGAIVPFLRPVDISGDDSTDLEFFQHFLNETKLSPDYIIHLRPTTPLRIKGRLKEACRLISTSNWTAIRSIHKCSESAYKKVEYDDKEKYLKSIFYNNFNLDEINLERQSFKNTFSPNGYIDILRSDLILEGTIHGDKVLPFFTEEVIEIDSEWDFKMNELILNDDELRVRYE